MKKWRKRLVGGLRSWVRASSGRMEELYENACVKMQRTERIRTIQRNLLMGYLGLAMTGILLAAVLLTQTLTQHEPLRSVDRPERGQAEQLIPIKAVMKRGNVKQSQEINLRVGPEPLSEEEKRRALNALAVELPKRILGENTDLQHIICDLILDQLDEGTGITLDWETDRPDLVDRTGTVCCLSSELPQKVVLSARLEFLGTNREKKIPIQLVTPSESESKAVIKAMERAVKRAALELPASSEGPQVRLPETLPGGVQIIWKRRGSIPFFPLFLLLAIGFFLVWRSGPMPVHRDIRKEREEMAREFPDFLNRLVLLLSAGMVIQAALERISTDYENHRKGGVKPLYEAVLLMEENIHQTNSPLSQELIKLAKRSGLRELARFSSIVNDNLQKGSGLTDKLTVESELLWMNRKKKAQEQGRIAETKLTLPLMLLLVILIVLTTAPALMEISGL